MPLALVFPEKDEDQLANQLLSEVRIFHTHGEPPVIFTCPATSSFAHAILVPIPIFSPS